MNNHLIFAMKSLIIGLTFVAQVQLAAPAHGQPLPTALNVVVVQGEGSTSRVRQRARMDPAIRVEDENRKPVSGAAVVFTLPTEGATGTFGTGSKTLTVLTDSQGVATAQGLRLNQVPGKVQMHVNVSYRGLTARTTITQFSEAPAGYKIGGGGRGKVVAILAVLAAGGAGGAYYATRKSASPPAAVVVPPSGPTPIGITAGTGVISPPR